MAHRHVKQAAAKRFRQRGSGSFKHYSAGKRHYLTKRSSNSKRKLRLGSTVHDHDHFLVRDALGLG